MIPTVQYRPFVVELPYNLTAGTQLLITAYVGDTVDGKTELRVTLADRPAEWMRWSAPIDCPEAP